MVHNPQPWTACFLGFALPILLLGSGVALRRTTRDLALAVVLTPGVALAVWLFGIHVASLVARSFSIGLWVGTLAVTLGAWGAVHQSRIWRESLWPYRTQPLSRIAWASALLATLFLLPAALGWCFHDEPFITGHMSIASQIENGHYPPHHGVFGAELLRYHYGFNLLCALVGTISRLPIDRVIDVVTIGCWFYSWCLLWSLGGRLAGPRFGWTAAPLALLGGGAPFFVPLPGHAPLVDRLLQLNHIFGAVVNPPIASYFFQHPWTLGIPIALCALGVFLSWEPPSPRTRAALLLFLLPVLALSQIVLFLTFWGGMLATTIIRERRNPRRLIVVVLFGIVVFGLACSFGGFFAPQTAERGLGLEWHLFSQAGNLRRNLLWMLGSLGAVLPLALAGMKFLRTDARVVIALIAGGSLVIVNVLRYAHSWDIYKFATVASLVLAFPAAAALQRLSALRPRGLVLGATIALLVFAILPGAGYLSPFLFRMQNLPYFFWTCPPRPSSEHVPVIDWLRRHAQAGDVVYTEKSLAETYAQWSGLPQVHSEATTDDFGFPPAILEAREQLVNERPDAIEPYLREGVRWIVLDREDSEMERIVGAWESEGRAHQTAGFERIRIVELH